jgi:hypothetical protein
MSLGKSTLEPMPYPDYEKLYEAMTDEQKIDHQLAEMNKPKIVYRTRSGNSDTEYGFAGGLLVGSMLF